MFHMSRAGIAWRKFYIIFLVHLYFDCTPSYEVRVECSIYSIKLAWQKFWICGFFFSLSCVCVHNLICEPFIVIVYFSIFFLCSCVFTYVSMCYAFVCVGSSGVDSCFSLLSWFIQAGSLSWSQCLLIRLVCLTSLSWGGGPLSQPLER